MENIYTDPSLVSGGLLSATAAPAAAPISITDAQRWLYPRYGEQVGVRSKLLEAMTGLGFNGQNISGMQDLRQLEALSGMSPAELSDLYAQLERDNGKQFMNDGADWIKAQALQGRATTKQAQDWLEKNGYRVDTQDNGSVQTQRLLDSQGRSVAEDVFDYQSYLNSENKAVDTTAAITAAVLGGMAAYGGVAGGAGASSVGADAGHLIGSQFGGVDSMANIYGGLAQASAGAGGVKTLDSSLIGSNPTVTTPSIQAGTGGMTGGSGITGYVPSWEEAVLGGAGAGGGGVGGMSSADKAALLGDSGYGAGMTGAETGAFDTVLGATGSSGLADLASKGAGALGTISDFVGGGKNLAGIVGGIAGATQGGKDQTATTTQQIDPRMAQYLYGTGYGDKNSLLGAAQDWWKNNQSGMNANMQQGLDTLKSLYTSPSYSQGYSQMRDVGQGLLGRPIAGNPFTQGGLLGAPMQQPMQQPIQAPRPDIGSPFGPTVEIGGGRFAELNPNFGNPQELPMPTGTYINEQQRIAAAQQPGGLLTGGTMGQSFWDTYKPPTGEGARYTLDRSQLQPPQQMPGPDVGLQKFNRPAWSI